MESSVTRPVGPLATALRRAGGARLAAGFFVMCLGAAVLTEAVLGPRGLAWFRAGGAGTAGGAGVAFAWIWAYFTIVRLARGRSWPRALGEAALPASLLFILALWTLRALGH